MASGISKMADRRRPSCTVWGGFLVLIGALFLADNFSLLHVNFNTIWPLALVAGGASMLVRVLRGGGFKGRNPFDESTLPYDTLKEVAVFSGIKRKLETKTFQGGEVTCVFGGVDLDLRRAGFAPGVQGTTIDITTTFGGVEIKIPETWRVTIRGVAVFGAYEDKSVAPRPEAGILIPELVITGNVVFGAVNIEN
jgi:hypothetical protein